MIDYPPFDWIPFYKEFADILLTYKDRREELMKILDELFQEIKRPNPFSEKSSSSYDTCPFTIFASFNRNLKDENRLIILQGFKEKFGVKSPLPTAFPGIPLMNNQAMWYYRSTSDNRKPTDIPNLWALFEAAIKYADKPTASNKDKFIEKYNLAIAQDYVSWNITMGLFWIRPEQYVNLESTNRNKINNFHILPYKLSRLPTGDKYLQIIDTVSEYLKQPELPYHTFVEFSHYAYEDVEDENPVEQLNTIKSVMSQTISHPKNQILFGPPGTGKTYSTVLHAVSIIENVSLAEIEKEEYSKILKRYQQYREEGRIASVTFHQSYGYEEFIEGIRPVLDEYENTVSYTIEDGIFKEFCRDIRYIEDVEFPYDLLNDNPTIWKYEISRDDDYNPLLSYDFYSLEGKNSDGTEDTYYNRFFNEMKVGDIVLSNDDGSLREEIGDIGIITGSVIDILDIDDEDWESEEEYKKWYESSPHYQAIRPIHIVVRNTQLNVRPYNRNIRFASDSMYHLKRMNLKTVERIIADLKEETKKPYVFIIDEINRGNISKIFGELISLIEPSKRLGTAESMKVKLPYSQHDFGVPQNVYIIGTMNTADRSLAFLDTALRRRFTFTEMLPNPKLLEGIEIEGINLSLMLAKINERIEALYDREHTIGHAYFMGLKDAPTIENLAEVFKTAILPLLQEYFFNDYAKIRLVLGDNYADDNISFIREIPINSYALFGCDVDEICDVRYEINSSAFCTKEAYQKIYQT